MRKNYWKIKKLLNLIWDAVVVGERCREMAVWRSAIEADGDIASEMLFDWFLILLCVRDSCFHWKYDTMSFQQLFSKKLKWNKIRTMSCDVQAMLFEHQEI